MLKDARWRARLSQREVAALAGVPQSTVARIENRTLSPRVETLGRVLAVLGFTLEARGIYGRGVDRTLIRGMLALEPLDRVRYAVAGGQAAAQLRGAVLRSRS